MMTASRADCGHVEVSARVLGLLADPARLRRLRVAYRPDPAVYPELLAVSALVLGGVSATKVAITSECRNAGYMTTSEYAAAARLSRNAVRRAAREGRIPARKIGRQWLIEGAPAC